jgi:hypothetical protein
MEAVYELRNAARTIAHMQRGSKEPGPLGLRITHGLVGSDEWWAQIRSGALPLKEISGVVSDFWSGQRGGGPAEFQLRQTDGAKSTWSCGLEPERAKRQFRIGRAVTVQYVTQELKTEFAGRRETEVPICITLD